MEHHKHYTPKMILKTWQDILCFHEIVMRANPWPCSSEIFILPFVVLILGKQPTLSNMLREFSTVQENASTIQSISLYETFRWLEALSNTFKLSVVQPPSIDQADSCPLASWVHDSVKALAQAAFIPQTGSGWVWVWCGYTPRVSHTKTVSLGNAIREFSSA